MSGKFERQQKLADSRFAILMALFYQIKSCLQILSCSTMNENTKKTGEIIFSVTQNRTCELPQFLSDFDDYAVM